MDLSYTFRGSIISVHKEKVMAKSFILALILFPSFLFAAEAPWCTGSQRFISFVLNKQDRPQAILGLGYGGKGPSPCRAPVLNEVKESPDWQHLEKNHAVDVRLNTKGLVDLLEPTSATKMSREAKNQLR